VNLDVHGDNCYQFLWNHYFYCAALTQFTCQMSNQHESRSASSVMPAWAGTSNMSRHAFWIMSRRVALMAAGVDMAFLLIFWLLDSPVLAWMNLVSIAMYLGAFWALKKRFNHVALALIWTEVLGHAAIGSMLAGWDSGFHYYLLMFIPAIVVSGRGRSSVRLLLLVLLVFYLGLHTVSRVLGVMAPLSSLGLTVVHTFNVVIVFGMASYTARFYYGAIRRAEKGLVELAMRDPLTGLANRRSLIAQAEREMARARRSGMPIALIIADIDHFKQINDQCGHDVGDRVIAQAGSLMQQLSRSEDVVARWGGEEFLLLLPMTGIEAASELAERIRQTMQTAEVLHVDQRVPFTFSLGVAALRVGESLDISIARADHAMYQSKTQGRNRVTVVT
jgi:diguanylate cyclase (GGDEF)-like protein